ncbi:GNAT family N-acetyltransferase [Desulfosediminicola flagellatus]|uniref:GNAT family N-acetyltransferase n=1 Tax=Desulfosediminicola flagellatus TaxID=2569541 RepID=UPI0010AD6D1C|nr:GNAT family N-acetyltransferase [Desulfosediminicola flagellatus]
MSYSIYRMGVEDGDAVMNIFNHYIEHTFAAYREEKLPASAFSLFLDAARGYPALVIKDESGKLLGFGMLRAHKAIQEFAHTAEFVCFLHPDHLRAGLGKQLLDRLVNEGKEIGFSSILSNISSRNPGSIRFHEKNGFVECGRFVNIGKKHGKYFDTVWMQKRL